VNQAHTRRRFLSSLGAATAVLGGLPWTVGSAAASKPPLRVVVIGGGFGGATVARYLRLWGQDAIEVVLIERGTHFVSCPLSNLVIGGTRRIEELTLGYEGLRARGVRVLHDEVLAIDHDRKRVRLGRSDAVPYDRLIISPGIDFLYDQLPALQDARAQEVFPHAWKAGPQTVALRAQLAALPEGGTYVISIPKAPYRCPPGPYERVCQVAYYFKSANPRAKILVLDANPDLVSKKALFIGAWNDLYPGMIEYLPNQEAKDVDWRTRTVHTEFDSFSGGVVNVLPPMRAGSIAVQAGLVTANNRWCGVDWRSMESVAVAGVHVLGDATLSAPAMPKSASMANNHAKIAASAIVAITAGEPINPMPTINNTCYSYLSDRHAVHVDSVHTWDPEQKTLASVKGAGGVSPGPTEAEKGYADAWARNIWADTLS
jgi:sulfide dehydrogenase [flavocytochrome c] flavoprotein chain